MYNEHFGLQQAPFRITPDTGLFYEGGGRGEILDALVYAILSGEGIVKVVGEVGTGKTMLCRMLEERLPENVEIVYLANPSLKPDDILQAIALEMNLELAPGSNRLKVMHAMQQHLLQKHAANRQVVVFVEEAQSMPIETLEEIRLLTNLETKREKLLQIVLFGQPELDQNLDQPNIRQLKERITHSFYLEPLKRNELRDYVNFRMRAVGYKGPDVFRSNASVSMSWASEGLTRRINILADKALLAAYAHDRHEVKFKDVRKAINDSRFESRRRRLPELTLAAGVLMLTGAVGWSVFEPLENFGRPNERPVAVAVDPGPVPGGPEKSPPAAASEPARAGSEVADLLPAQNAMLQEAASQAPVGAAPIESAWVKEQRATATAASPEPGIGDAASAGSKLMAAGDRAAMRSPQEFSRIGGQATEAVSLPAAAEAVEAAADASTTARPWLAQGNGTVVAEVSSSDLIAARLAATRQWLARADDNHYSIQLLLTAQSQRRHVEAFLEQRHRQGEIDQVYVYETVIDRRPYLGVLYREFSAYSAAKRALEDLRPEFKRLGPFIRNLRDVSSMG
jgi:type II secretory pathway predicted ATPase ExeA/septal ring-binding cell division protein DamX